MQSGACGRPLATACIGVLAVDREPGHGRPGEAVTHLSSAEIAHVCLADEICSGRGIYCIEVLARASNGSRKGSDARAGGMLQSWCAVRVGKTSEMLVL
jgi:hypothetical protein